MNIKIAEEKLNTLKTNGVKLTSKQISYLDNHYDPIDNLESLVFHWTPEELILRASNETLKDFESIAGYDFSIDLAPLFVKLGEESLMVVNSKDDIQFFKQVVIDIMHNTNIDDEGNYIDEE
ncbi:hypothetical protein [Paenibacillus pini]|uniref:Uncharacterized protein n=2 Tax=Paenibacillus TaxID=44249 RepID=W7YUK5_9BACL|nr:hypothetical protein JCM16418_5137 [Paenibacillus pini JCM 16418]